MTDRAMLTDISAEIVRARLIYDPATGIFTRRVAAKGGRNANIGDVVGAKMGRGYLSIRISGKSYLAHRLAWLYVHGEWPSKFLDHKDGDRSNNTLENLRHVSRAQNCRNAKRRLGYNFIKNRPHPKQYQATIWVNNKSKHLGFFLTSDEARAVYLAATQKYFGEFSVENRLINSEFVALPLCDETAVAQAPPRPAPSATAVSVSPITKGTWRHV